MKKISFLSALTAVFTVAANPLNFTCYEQSFTLEFADEKSASEAEAIPRGLPGKYTLAFTSRWDDSTESHLNTLKVMTKYGAKGNFYLGGNIESKKDTLFKKLTSTGSRAGSHTCGHHPMKFICANEHFYEYMANRIAIEVKSSTPVNTQASPYGQIRGLTKEGTMSIGRSLISTGIIGSPDSSSPKHIHELGYPEKACAFVYRITPGDRVPDMKKYETMLKKYLSSPALKNDPCISMSTHSWHTEEGLKLLDEIYRQLTSHKEWWNCNQNEYASYRYEALNTLVKKEVTGKSVKFTVLRFEPFELGADVPLYFDIIGSKPLSASGAELDQEKIQVKLRHKAGHNLPEKYGYKTLQDVKLSLNVSENDGKVTADIINNSGRKIEDATLIFRFAPMYEKRTVRVSKKLIGKQEKVTVNPGVIGQKSRHFTLGKPYFAVQMDYSCDGKRCRLYADAFGSEMKSDKLTLGEVMVYYTRPKKWNDSAKLSLPDTDVSQYKFTALRRVNPKVCSVGAAYPGKIARSGCIGIAHFNSDSDCEISVRTHIRRGGKLFLNGKELKHTKNNKIKVKKGINRLLFSGDSGSAILFDADVQYIPSK